jgi:hypothetical protein
MQKGMQMMQRHEKNWRPSVATALCWAVVALMASGAILGNVSYAGGKVFREEWKVPDFYPRMFDGYGIIGIIYQDRIVINDHRKKLSSSAVYATPSSPSASKSSFRAGNTVAYLLDHKKEIISLWLIK